MAETQTPTQYSTREKILAGAVHVYTATGVVWALVSLIAIVQKNYALFWAFNVIAVIVDSSDGYFARKFQVKKVLPFVDGRKLDDIADYLNYTFLPLFALWHMKLLPQPGWLWVSFPLLASLFAFAYEGVKEEGSGFFVGFPSYWNFVVIYIALGVHKVSGPWGSLGFLLLFTVLNVVPLRFVYPSMAKRWKAYFIWGAIAWTVLFLYMLTQYNKGVSSTLVWISLTYPASYMILSVYLDFEARREAKKQTSESSP
jgi:phosphatidylcholine synthase